MIIQDAPQSFFGIIRLRGALRGKYAAKTLSEGEWFLGLQSAMTVNAPVGAVRSKLEDRQFLVSFDQKISDTQHNI